MALNQLSEKLDALAEQDLGFAFDNAAVWAKLEGRLDNRRVYPYWWVAAACLMIGMTLLPISLMKTGITENPALSNNIDTGLKEPASIKAENGKKVIIEEFKVPKPKGIEPAQVAELSNIKLSLVPIALPNSQQEVKKAAFAEEDISIIQASLGRPPIENGRTMTIRAQWQNSTEELNVNYQALKIKLYEKDRNQ